MGQAALPELESLFSIGDLRKENAPILPTAKVLADAGDGARHCVVLVFRDGELNAHAHGTWRPIEVVNREAEVGDRVVVETEKVLAVFLHVRRRRLQVLALASDLFWPASRSWRTA